MERDGEMSYGGRRRQFFPFGPPHNLYCIIWRQFVTFDLSLMPDIATTWFRLTSLIPCTGTYPAVAGILRELHFNIIIIIRTWYMCLTVVFCFSSGHDMYVPGL